MEKMENGMENNGENSGPLSSLPVDRLTATDCNAERSCQNDSGWKTGGYRGSFLEGFDFKRAERGVPPIFSSSIFCGKCY